MSNKNNTTRNNPIPLYTIMDQAPIINRLMDHFGTGKNFSALGRELGFSAQGIRYYAVNQRGIGWDFVFAVMKKTGKGADWVLFGKEEKKSNGVIIDFPVQDEGSRLTRGILAWVESHGNDSRHYDSAVYVAVKKWVAGFEEWEKKRPGGNGGNGNPSGLSSIGP